MNEQNHTKLTSSRRALLRNTGVVALGGAALALLAQSDGIAIAASPASSADIDSLNAILGLDHEAIAAYEIAATSGLLSAQTLPVARLFQSHHKGHRDALTEVIRKAGGKPIESKTNDAYAKDINAAALKSETDVLKLAATLEGAATAVYINAIGRLGNRKYARLVSQLVADETMHWTVLTSALRESLPAKAFSFGV